MSDLRPTNLLSIGDFSRYAGVSIRMLRHYDERGLLHPADVDPVSGYRRYSPAQLQIAGRIRSLRDAGCGIPAIAEMLPLFDSPTELRARLDQHLAALGEASKALADQQGRAASLVNDLVSNPTTFSVGDKLVPTVRVLYLRRQVADYPAEGDLWAEFAGLEARHGAIDSALLGGLIGATYFDDDYRDEDVEMAIWREYSGTLSGSTDFEIVELPEQRVAWTTHRGDFSTLDRATAALGIWIAEQGHTRVGPVVNTYVYGPGRDPHPANWVTEVSVPIQ